MKVCLVRIHYGVSHTALIGHISNLHLAQQSHLVALQSRLVYYAGILQNLLLETDSAQQLTLLSLGSMILKVLAEVALVACLGYGVTHSRQFHLYHVLKFSHELIVAFLRHIFHNVFFVWFYSSACKGTEKS